MKKYEKLKNQYPEYISLDQLYKICRIAKRTARYLVEHQIIPAIDTGRKTWRYKIAIDDVITYLRRCEQWGSMIPPGATSSRPPHLQKPYISFYEVIKSSEKNEVYRYFEHICEERDDVLTVAEIVEITGLNEKKVIRLLKNGTIKPITRSPRYLIPKMYLLEFVVSLHYLEIKSNKETFTKIVKGFEVWKNSL